MVAISQNESGMNNNLNVIQRSTIRNLFKCIVSTEQYALKSVRNCLNINIHSYLETSGGQSSNPYSNVVHFFQHQCLLDICVCLRQLFMCISVQYVMFFCFFFVIKANLIKINLSLLFIY